MSFIDFDTQDKTPKNERRFDDTEAEHSECEMEHDHDQQAPPVEPASTASAITFDITLAMRRHRASDAYRDKPSCLCGDFLEGHEKRKQFAGRYSEYPMDVSERFKMMDNVEALRATLNTHFGGREDSRQKAIPDMEELLERYADKEYQLAGNKDISYRRLSDFLNNRTKKPQTGDLLAYHYYLVMKCSTYRQWWFHLQTDKHPS